MKSYKIDTEDAKSKGFAWAAMKDASIKNLQNISKFTDAQVKRAISIQAALMSVYNLGLDDVRINYRPGFGPKSQFIAIKIMNTSNCNIADLKFISDGWDMDTSLQQPVREKESGQGIIYCFKFL